jgi:hypothetical protein
MDEDTLELIQRLCTRAGMIMEDASVEALMATPSDVGAMSEKLTRLAEAAHTIGTIIVAAQALHQANHNVR